MRPFVWLFRIAVAIGLLIEVYFLTLWIGPDLEAALAPVLRNHEFSAVTRPEYGRLLCFTLTVDKVREASIEDAGWTLRGAGRIYPYQRVRTVADSQGVEDGLARRPVGSGHWTRKCIDLPAGLIDRPLTLTGFAEYRTAATGQFWTVRQRTPEVIIP
ncbi:hypothetical protein [Methylobacterium gnaphalii]|uniref:Uncharacterized protein n=1 Tax=Methylobacterium gnaphalii TaxID=1010610 RepID=A0A512JPI4_9HYPH|nr:hypothetical protein [Methylobacterium gnaphalii]GEP11842.1 hypothetical protein MGN01_36870 [Methylobacterium gnaphalii]GJD69425.1 hypothetical protein MMMDOFMJ_2356 [Methylobacterium gnaphalii]GLS49618.1 hypothetical protein GCM10007885_24670 [Methylobacterium gnaphalii]